ncbi:hypothetical protein BaRGS_00034640 [Batillaria attramentaria]|uniref:Uncharacterized protein n=1 Tax=Batillaria attramentaria TaxID=370345 RepID=A0ABD0JGY8_9CAEN
MTSDYVYSRISVKRALGDFKRVCYGVSQLPAAPREEPYLHQQISRRLSLGCVGSSASCVLASRIQVVRKKCGCRDVHVVLVAQYSNIVFFTGERGKTAYQDATDRFEAVDICLNYTGIVHETA